MMSDPMYLHIQAERCFRLARGSSGPRLADELEALGRAFEREARELELPIGRLDPGSNPMSLVPAAASSRARAGGGLGGNQKRLRYFLGVATRWRVVDYRRLIWPGYRDRSRRVLVGPRCRRVGWRLRRGAGRLGCSWLLSSGRRN